MEEPHSPRVGFMSRRRGMSPRAIARMMKQMGIEQKDVSGVKEVIFRFEDKEWLITDPQVVMIKGPFEGVLQTFIRPGFCKIGKDPKPVNCRDCIIRGTVTG